MLVNTKKINPQYFKIHIKNTVKITIHPTLASAKVRVPTT
jgi:hypothetical protein